MSASAKEKFESNYQQLSQMKDAVARLYQQQDNDAEIEYIDIFIHEGETVPKAEIYCRDENNINVGILKATINCPFFCEQWQLDIINWYVEVYRAAESIFNDIRDSEAFKIKYGYDTDTYIQIIHIHKLFGEFQFVAEFSINGREKEFLLDESQVEEIINMVG